MRSSVRNFQGVHFQRRRICRSFSRQELYNSIFASSHDGPQTHTYTPKRTVYLHTRHYAINTISQSYNPGILT